MATQDPGRAPTMEDVAARAGVSRALVSIVFRDQPGASLETRARVRSAAADLGYAPDRRARLLSRRRTGQIGVVFGLHHSFHGELVEALYRSADVAGYEIALSGFGPARSEQQAADDLVAYRCEALILLGPTCSAAALRAAAGRVPTVVVARSLREPSVDVVRTDDIAGAGRATDHLLRLGHREIAHVDGGRAPGAAERRRGFRRAMAAAAVERPLVLRGGLTAEDGARAGTALVGLLGGASHARPTAVTVFNDECAVGLIHVVRAAGHDVPADLSVVGYDDTRVARLPWVQLTTVAQDVPQLASQAVRHVVARIEGTPGPRETIVPPTLVARSSTAPPTPARPADTGGDRSAPAG